MDARSLVIICARYYLGAQCKYVRFRTHGISNASVVIYSLIETARANGLEPFTSRWLQRPERVDGGLPDPESMRRSHKNVCCANDNFSNAARIMQRMALIVKETANGHCLTIPATRVL
jgi:hypothetical protein